MPVPEDATVSVRYLVDDVAASLDFYTTHFGFTPNVQAAPAFADVTRGNLRLLLSGPLSSAGQPMADGERPCAGGWNRIHLIVDDLDAAHPLGRAVGEGAGGEDVPAPGGAVARSVHLDLRLHEQVAGEGEGRCAEAGGDLVAARRRAEGRATVPDPVLGERGGDVLGDAGQVVLVAEAPPFEAGVHEVAVPGLQLVDGEHGLGGVEAAAQRPDLRPHVLVAGAHPPFLAHGRRPDRASSTQ